MEFPAGSFVEFTPRAKTAILAESNFYTRSGATPEQRRAVAESQFKVLKSNGYFCVLDVRDTVCYRSTSKRALRAVSPLKLLALEADNYED